MGQDSYPATVLLSPSRRYARLQERTAWAALAVTTLVYYNLWRCGEGLAHIEFLTGAANSGAVKAALITSALATGVLMRLNRLWWRVALCWVLSLVVGWLLIGFACVDMIDDSPGDALRVSSTSLGGNEAIAAYSSQGKGDWKCITVRRERVLLPGVVWTHPLYQSPRPAMPPIIRRDAGDNLRLVFPPSDDEKYKDYSTEFYMTGEVVVPLR